jgi:DNA-binding NtrC family response regulator
MDVSTLSILIVDDEESIRVSLSEFLQDFEFEVDSADSAEDALEMLKHKKYNVLIVDLRLPDMNGDLLILKAYEIDNSLNFLIHTGSVEFTIPDELISIGMTQDNIFVKPITNLMKICEYIENVVKS